MRMFMKKFLIAASSLAILCLLTACGDSNSAKACQKPVYCYKTTDEPNARKCDWDKEVADEKAKEAEKAGKLHTPLYEDCWDF